MRCSDQIFVYFVACRFLYVCSYSLHNSLCDLNCCKAYKLLMKNIDCHRFYFQFTTFIFLYQISCLVLTSSIFELLSTIDMKNLKRFYFSLTKGNHIFKNHEKRGLMFVFGDHVFIVTNDVRLKGINLAYLLLV